MKTSYFTVPRRWPGATIACVASGPSLTAEDAAYLRGRTHVIAVNDGIRLTADFADVLYSSDWRFWKHSAHAAAFHGPKLAIEQAPGAGRRHYHEMPDVQMLRYAGGTGLESQPDGLRCNSNSGAAAINLAVHFGARLVLLLGYNCGPLKGRTHFFEASDRPWQQAVASEYPNFRRKFDSMVAPLADAGVTVLNCTPDTHLTCFPTAMLREVLPADAVAAPDACEEAVA